MMHFPDFRPGHYMFPIHHKTIFLLDHTPYFGISSDVHLELNPSKPRSGMIPLRPISKSLWTCSVEAAIEYSRVVWDLFSEGKLIRFVVSDTQGRVLNSWATEQQNIYRVLGSLSGVGAPPKLTAATTSVDYSIVKGFRAAIEAVCECTEMQNCSRTILTDRPEDVKIPNRCRIICITSALDDESIRNLENMFWNELQAVNKSVEDSNHLIPITQCHLLIMNTYPNGTDPAVNNHPTKELSSMLTSEVIKCPAYDYLCHELLRLLLQHYDLASTTITGIPMKEEQNANSSANYDVEVFHSREAHHSILNGGLVDLKRIRSTKKEGNYPTITLKWSTPRGPVPDVKSCTTLHRITPVNINSRPSACLVTFLLNGRTVLLESGCSDESKIMSHMLTSYGGELFIQSIHVSRNNCNGLALLANSKSKGSAVSDYRKQEFKSLMTAFELKPMKSIYMEESSKKPNTKHPYQQAVNSVKRETKFWPYTVSSNIIFNVLEYTEPLLSLFRKYQLTQEEVYRCKLCICNLAYLDAKKREPFPLPNLCIKGEKITRRDEQFKLLWDELSQYMKAFGKSATHKDVIACVADFRSKSENALIFEKLNMEQALGEVERDKVQLLQRGTVIHTTDTPLSPTEVLLQSSESSSDSDDESEKKLYNGIHSFGEIWLRTRVEKDCLVDLPPYKRLTNAKPNEDGTGFISRLYPNLSSDSDENESETEKHTQTTQEVGDIIIETHNDQNTSNLRHIVPVRVDNKAAERSRLYRERNREKINRRRRDIRESQKNLHRIHTVYNVQDTDEIEKMTQEASNNKLSSNPHAQRQRRYYERHKEEINKCKRDRKLKSNISQSIPATAAERNRNYRERNRQEVNERRRDSRLRQQNLQRIHTEGNINNIDAIEQIMEATPNGQQSLNSSNDDTIQEMAPNFTSTPQQHNTQHFEETQNDRVQITTAAFQATEAENARKKL